MIQAWFVLSVAIITGSLWLMLTSLSATGKCGGHSSAWGVNGKRLGSLCFLTNFSPCRVKEASGWQLAFCSPRLDWVIERVALNARVLGGSLGDSDKMVAAASCSEILLWALQPDGSGTEIGEKTTPTCIFSDLKCLLDEGRPTRFPGCWPCLG